MIAKKRLEVVKSHISGGNVNCHWKLRHSASNALDLVRLPGVEIQPPPPGCTEAYHTLLSPGAVTFLANLVRKFDAAVDDMLARRRRRKLELDHTRALPDFPADTAHIRRSDWSVPPPPRRLRCRHVDLGDVSPANTTHFTAALRSTAQGIQTDLDDGHCPVWARQLLGLYNVQRAVQGTLPGVPALSEAPVLMLRPRAWNMVENNMLVDGKVVPGPLFDFGLLMYHNATELIRAHSGPFFYLSKIEGYQEARLWNDIFVWTQNELEIPVGTIKACVLIENILASFEMDEILYELREHSAGLNCGIWDYSASFVKKFGNRPEFLIPDRSKYVSMDRHFLKSYMDLVVQTCHRRNALATGGMAAPLLPSAGARGHQEVIDKVNRAKIAEIHAGVDGFMVYDLGLVTSAQTLFSQHAPTDNQIHVKRSEVNIRATDLLQMPSGGVTLDGLKHNIGVGILFIYAWLSGQGHYFYKGAVEDSATAEISRSQIWQWIRHCTLLEDASRDQITRAKVHDLIQEFIQHTLTTTDTCCHDEERRKLVSAAEIFEEVVTKHSFPEFITTYLYEEHAVRSAHGM